MSEIELLPCPFCGSSAFIRSGKEDFGRVRVGCSNEDCTARTTIVGYHKDEWAIEAWNTRHTPDITELQAENARLRERLAAVEGEQERLSDNEREIRRVLTEIGRKVTSGDWKDLVEREYWQGKKDAFRIALSLLKPNFAGSWVGSIESSPTSVFLPSEEALIERAKQQKREQQPAAPQGGENGEQASPAP